ncbi:hypothetical protein ABL78_5727 [Leptomonas seymouri]|uniref:Uncharacterized protein n=1 Tax=Leptomonas seymouri TaxID=5684 RepID=A0A0N0P4F1_LEPSE|nr:hypothetical protein ABL78_5727 [Leptomonas seymouri]|eukprot:KPI85219.1 hypothetical protein ABL78_5727 [Leptomonas seymouri]
MEGHSSASMYIPSSKVLARLQRHAVVSTPPPNTQLAKAGSSSNAGGVREDNRQVTSSSKPPPVGTGNTGSAPASAPSGSAATQVQPSPPPRSPLPRADAADTQGISVRAAAASNTSLPSTQQLLALPPAVLSVAAAASTGRAEQAGSGAKEDVAAGVDAVSALPSPSAPSARLLPHDDMLYVFSSLTWNIDLLRLLLPHAPCPLHLPPTKAQSDPEHAQPSITLTSSDGAEATARHLCDADATLAVAGGDADGGSGCTSSSKGGRPNNETEEAPTASLPPSSSPPSRVGPREGLLEDEEARSRAPPPGLTHRSPASVAQEGGTEEVGSQEASTDLLTKEIRPDSPPASASASATQPALTWSQYLFRGSASQHLATATTSSNRNTQPRSSAHAGCVSACPATHNSAHRDAPSNASSGSAAVPSLAPPRSRIDGALLRPAPLNATATQPSASSSCAANTHTSTATGARSIFHSHYLPSLEEFQRDLEVKRQLQQQRQHRRRTAANKTFFYSPTPSVVSVATTSVNASMHVDDDKEECAHAPLHDNANLSSQNTGRISALASIRRPSYAAVVAVSSRSSPSPSYSGARSLSRSMRRRQPSQHTTSGLTALRLRQPTSSAPSLDDLCVFDEDSGELRDSAAGLDGTAPRQLHKAEHHHGESPLSASMCSRLSQQQPSAMMLRALMASSVREPPSPPGQVSQTALRTSHSNRKSGGSAAIMESKGKTLVRAEAEVKSNSSAKDDDSSSSSSVFPSSPATPVGSITSMSFNTRWSSFVSGRATPHSIAGGGAGAEAGGNCSFSLCCGSPRRKKKKNVHRRKAARTCRQRHIHIYIPSITEGPKAASLYTAPTAEAQEWLLLLHRAPLLSRSGVAAATLAATPTRIPHLPSVPLLASAASAGPPALGTAVRPGPTSSSAAAAQAGASAQGQSTPAALHFSQSDCRSNGAGATAVAGDRFACRNGNEQHAIHSSLLHTSTGTTPAEAAASPPIPRNATAHGGVVRKQPAVACASSSPPARPSTQLSQPYTNHSNGAGGCSRLSPLSGSSASIQSGWEQHDTHHVPGSGAVSAEGRDKSSEAAWTHAADAPPTPVELPKWVRERSLSALYYQPWGLELLARYEQQQQLRQQQLQQQQQFTTMHSRPAKHSTGLRRFTGVPAAAGAATTRASSFQRTQESHPPLSHADTASLCASLSSTASSALIPSLSVTSNGDAGGNHTPAVNGNAAARCPPVLTCASLGTPQIAAPAPTSAASVSASTTSGLRLSSDASSSLTTADGPPITWAAALRQPHASSTATSALPGSCMPTAKTTAHAAAATTTSASVYQSHHNPVLEWPPELSAAEERDAREEALYFGSDTGSLGSPKYLSAGADVFAVEHAAGREADAPPPGGSSSMAPTAAHHPQRRYGWCPGDMAHLPTLYLSRQKRSRRRLRVSQDDAVTRSSTARRGTATSAAAELQSKRASARAAAAAAAASAGEQAEAPTTSAATAASTTRKDDVLLFGGTYRRKKAAQLYYPPPPSSWTAASMAAGRSVCAEREVRAASPPPPSSFAAAVVLEKPETPSHDQHLRKAAGSAKEEAAVAAAATASAFQHESDPPRGVEAEAKVQHGGDEDADAPSFIAEAAARPLPLSRQPSRASPPHQQPLPRHHQEVHQADGERHARQQQQQPPPVPEVGIDFFLQKFLRAVMIVVITQVRLQQQQQQRQRQHDMSCPMSAYLLDVYPLSHLSPFEDLPSCQSAHAPHNDRMNGGGGSHGLSAVERHALAFVRRHMGDYRAMITAYVMRDAKEVARRSAQSILSDSFTAAAATAPGQPFDLHDTANEAESTDPHNGDEHPRPRDPLFQRRVLEGFLNSSRVNGVYEAAVHAAGGYTDTPTVAALDDVEALRTAQLYIGGKDAAWQPLLMELLQVSRVVQCYSEGPLQPTGGGSGGVPNAAATGSAAGTPQQCLQASLERLLAQPTVPLLRAAAPAAAPARVSPALPPSAAMSSPGPAVDRLTPAQAAVAMQMTEESEAFRRYLLAGYLSDPTVGATPAGSPLPSASATSDLARHTPSQPHSAQGPARPSPSVLQPLRWYPYAYMPGIASPYAESADPYSTRITLAQAASASAMTLYVAMLPLSGRLIWKWVVPAEDTDTFNLSVFFQSSLFTFMQGGPLPMPTSVLACHDSSQDWSTQAAPSSLFSQQQQPMLPSSSSWPPMLAASIDARLRQDASRSAWGGGPPPCSCDRPQCEAVVEEAEVALVHCSAGMHRSCGILVAFLLWLLYQCQQVLAVEKQLQLNNRAEVSEVTLERVVGDPPLDDAGRSTPPREAGGTAAAPPEGDTPVTSRLLRRCINHVQGRRSVAVPIRTVQCLLQSFANELQLN